MGLGIIGVAVLSAIVSIAVLAAVMNIGQARWRRRERDAHMA